MKAGRKKAAASALFASYLTRGLSVVLGFVVTPIVLRFLGPTDYGILAIIGSLLGYYGMLDLGVKGSASTLIARQQKDPSGATISKLASNTLAIHSATGLLVLAVGALSVGLVVRAMDLDRGTGSPIRLTLFLAVLALALSFPSQSLKAILRGTQQIARLRALEFGGLLVRTGLVLSLLGLGLGLPSLPIAGVVTTILLAGILLRSVKKNVPRLEISPRLVSRDGVSEVFGVSLWWFVGSLGALVIYQVDNLVIGASLGAAAVTPYVLTYRLSLLAREQIYQLNFILMPGIGDLVGRGDLTILRRVFALSFRLTVGAAIILASFLLLFNRALVSVWVGPENYSGDLVNALFAAFLLVAVVFHSSSVIVANFLRIRSISLVRVTEGIVNLVLSVVLVKHLGVAGVALSSVVAALLCSFWFTPWRAAKLLQLSWTSIRRDLLGPLFGLAALEVLLTAVFWPSRPSDLPGLLGWGATFLAVSAIGALLFLLHSDQRKLLLRGQLRQALAFKQAAALDHGPIPEQSNVDKGGEGRDGR